MKKTMWALCFVSVLGLAGSTIMQCRTNGPSVPQPMVASAEAATVEETNGLPTVVAITDGDTVDVVMGDATTKTIRLAGIDAPELKQEGGHEAKLWLMQTVLGKDVELQIATTDRYGRAVGTLTFEGRDVGTRLVLEGLAWWYVEYARTNAILRDAQAEAQGAERGIWAPEKPRAVAPWEYRRAKRAKSEELRAQSKGEE